MPYLDSSLYEYGSAQPSWWEASAAIKVTKAPKLSGQEICDVAIIGGGYTGLSAALHLARDHCIDVRLLEAGKIGWGASGRNGGFCCIGGTMFGPDALTRKYGLEETRRYYRSQVDAIELVAEIAEQEQIDITKQGDCEMVVAEKSRHFDALAKECAMLRDLLGIDARMISQQAFREDCYDAPHQHGALAVTPGFGLHPLDYCLGLADAAARRGAKLHPHSEVIRWDKNGEYHHLETDEGAVRAKHVIVACNGFMPEHLGEALKSRIIPLQSHIIVTQKLSEDQIIAANWKTGNPAVNSRNLYNYFRMLPDNRLLIGGRGDVKGRRDGAEKTAQALLSTVKSFWPEWQSLAIDYSWRGLVCFTSRMTPAIGRVEDDPTISMAYGYHGNGVNTASWAGRELARWLATGNDRNSTKPEHLPAILRGLSPRIPFGFLRRRATQAGIAWHRFKDFVDR